MCGGESCAPTNRTEETRFPGKHRTAHTPATPPATTGLRNAAGFRSANRNRRQPLRCPPTSKTTMPRGAWKHDPRQTMPAPWPPTTKRRNQKACSSETKGIRKASIMPARSTVPSLLASGASTRTSEAVSSGPMRASDCRELPANPLPAPDACASTEDYGRRGYGPAYQPSRTPPPQAVLLARKLKKSQTQDCIPHPEGLVFERSSNFCLNCPVGESASRNLQAEAPGAASTGLLSGCRLRGLYGAPAGAAGGCAALIE